MSAIAARGLAPRGRTGQRRWRSSRCRTAPPPPIVAPLRMFADRGCCSRRTSARREAADAAFAHELARAQPLRMEAHHERLGDQHVAGGAAKLLRLERGHRDRLLAQHVLAGAAAASASAAREGDSEAGCRSPRSRVGQQRLVGAVRSRDPQRVRALRARRRVARRDRAQVAPRLFFMPGSTRPQADPRTAEHTPSTFFMPRSSNAEGAIDRTARAIAAALLAERLDGSDQYVRGRSGRPQEKAAHRSRGGQRRSGAAARAGPAMSRRARRGNPDRQRQRGEYAADQQRRGIRVRVRDRDDERDQRDDSQQQVAHEQAQRPASEPAARTRRDDDAHRFARFPQRQSAARAGSRVSGSVSSEVSSAEAGMPSFHGTVDRVALQQAVVGQALDRR